jgi:uncharacterized protein YdeI (YjbR/CyaY-like superfamily)
MAPLEPLADGLGWVVAWLPFDATTAWPKMIRRRIVVEIAGQSFRTSLFAAKTAHGKEKATGHFVLVNKKMQQAAGAGAGAQVQFTIAPDLEVREAPMPPELARLLKPEMALLKWYKSLSETTRREIGKWIDGVESGEARMRRAQQMAERLMATMEGERKLPPVLEIALRRRPAAREGWESMTSAQRRSELMAIFYYQTPEARARRVEKVADSCMARQAR